MKRFTRGFAVGAVLFGLGAGVLSLTGCGATPSTGGKMGDKMGGDKMKDDKMGGDKMKDDKMGDKK